MKWATDSGDMQYVEQDSVESAIRMIDYYEETYRRIQETIVTNSIGETKEALALPARREVYFWGCSYCR